MLRTVLIANRGEIACRVARTCRRLGLRTVAVYSAADADARHVAEADEALLIGPPPVADSYGNAAAILDAARRAGADAIHPGFGFLSENADFARACQDAGVLFIGPDPDAIAAMGNKRAAKLLMAERGVPILPGYSGADQSDATLLREADRIGAPLMIKASAGGGGVGMRLVRDPDDLPAALASVRREAQAAFGSAEVI
ncbi:MAG TPA: biotin carboxylase N-terminal domain-containing protein, partial [Herpetosiphonaceae bacterium]|nr:biotin carboxylase N-terminal domain-containing protein [Herpetosiphonaceae bacterium]